MRSITQGHRPDCLCCICKTERGEYAYEQYIYKGSYNSCNPVEGVDYVVCPICEEWYCSLSRHLNACCIEHGTTKEEFLKLHPDLPMMAKTFLEKHQNRKGPSNPAWRGGVTERPTSS